MERTCRKCEKKHTATTTKIKAKLSTGAQINAKRNKTKCINDGCGVLEITRKGEHKDNRPRMRRERKKIGKSERHIEQQIATNSI